MYRCGFVLVLGLVLSLIVVPSWASDFDQSYRDYGALLRKHVDEDGKVDYSAVAKDKRLTAFLEAFGGLDPEEVGRWSRDQQVAFYINAYNAITLQTVVEAMPIVSIRAIQPDPWDNARWRVAGRTMSLNFIEHTRLRNQLEEPRVHFALVCASTSCPKLQPHPFLPVGLDQQLDRAARDFVTDPSRNRVDVAGARISLSRIFDWYGGDFEAFQGPERLPQLDSRGAKEAGVLRYVHTFLAPAERALLEGGSFEVVYSEYDWGLNQR